MKTMEIFWASLKTLLTEQHAREIKKKKTPLACKDISIKK